VQVKVSWQSLTSPQGTFLRKTGTDRMARPDCAKIKAKETRWIRWNLVV
jgi:hypothetical protein